MANVLRLDCSISGPGVIADSGVSSPGVWISYKAAFSATFLTWLAGLGSSRRPIFGAYDDTETYELEIEVQEGATNWAYDVSGGSGETGLFPASFVALQAYLVEVHLVAGSPWTAAIYLDAVSWGAITLAENVTGIEHFEFDAPGVAPSGSYIYIQDFKAGSTRGGSDIVADDFSGSLPGIWNEYYDATVASLVADPGIVAPGALAANFTGTPTHGNTPLSVQFTDTSTGGPSSWLWDFGDGHTSVEQNPLHAFIPPGVYDVSLTVA